ncbi:hypothetical protein R1X32_42620 [Rhodococcus opacus]|uniref:hypothetical protein n=1 Tax=Rhodococcus opacus TaxID=37919 RepID=UPI0034D37AA2
MPDLYEGDLDAVLASVPHTERARVLVDAHTRVAERFVAEFEAGLLTHAEAANWSVCRLIPVMCLPNRALPTPSIHSL